MTIVFILSYLAIFMIGALAGIGGLIVYANVSNKRYDKKNGIEIPEVIETTDGPILTY